MRCPSKFYYRIFGVVVTCDREEGHDDDHHGFAFDDDRAQGEKTWTNEEALEL